jgi:hypothetical protein
MTSTTAAPRPRGRPKKVQPPTAQKPTAKPAQNQIVIPYTPRPLQVELHASMKRWNLFVIHRRFGKSVWGINQILKDCLLCQNERPRFGYLAPLLKQAKDIAWDYLKFYSRAIPGIVINESELRIEYPNGGRIRLYGCDNPDTLRGIYLDGVIMDEYAQMPDHLLGEVIYPALADRGGYLVMLGTPKGKNHFYDRYQKALNEPARWNTRLLSVKDTEIFSEEQLDEIKQVMTKEEFEQEFLCAWNASVRGAYYADEIAAAREEKRITQVPHDSGALVDTWWDLGMDDMTSIWFTQDAGREIHVIDYYENADHGFEHYRDMLDRRKKERGYRYGRHIGPHDLSVRELGTGRSRLDAARSLGLNFEAAPRVRKKEDGISAVRRILGVCWFDEKNCQRGLECLENYRKKWDDERKTYRDKPEHDQYSHGADAFQTLALAHKFQGARKSSGKVVFLTAAGWT